jgi:hypothetical protein
VRQARDASRLSGLDAGSEGKVISAVSEALPGFSPDITPPEIAAMVYGIVGAISGANDPYKGLKEKSNKLAMELYPDLKRTVQDSSDKLLTAVRLAVAGNVIDYGVPHVFDVEREVKECLEKPFAEFHYEEFREAVTASRNILYILDNAGEIVFDRILIETIGKDLTAAVRSKPIINDVTMADAALTGLSGVCNVIESGSYLPGTVISKCTPEFMRHYREADLVISKGQGNYETLADEPAPIFFIFKAKCDVVARHLGCRMGDIILKRQSGTDDRRRTTDDRR